MLALKKLFNRKSPQDEKQPSMTTFPLDEHAPILTTFPPYEHTRLPLDSQCFRLACILPAAGYGYIRCKVFTVSLHDAPIFRGILRTSSSKSRADPWKALSYVWGPPDPTCSIEVDGCQMTIRKNLWRFMESKAYELTERRLNHSGYFFNDQICINQANSSERSHQVLHMADIYRAAREVVIWLGRETRCTKYGMAALARAHRALQEKQNAREGNCILPETEKRAMAKLAKNKFWGRLWIAQEVLLAQIVTLRWGGSQVPLQAVESYDTVYRFSKSLDWDRGMMLDIVMRRNDYQAGRPLTWAKASDMVRNRACKDVRDRIYGVLGLVRRCSLKPDYGLSLHEVYEEFLQVEIHPRANDDEMYEWQAEEWRATLGLNGFQSPHRSYNPAAQTSATYLQYDSEYIARDAVLPVDVTERLEATNGLGRRSAVR